MSNIPHFSKAPIVEAIFDFQAASTLERDFETFADESRQMVGADFPTCKKVAFNNFEITQRSPETAELVTDSGWLGCEYLNAEENQVLRFRKDGMSFHKLTPYTSYSELLPEVQKYWQQFAEFAQPKSITRLGLRFVNRVQLPAGTKFESLSDYVKVVPHVSLPEESHIQNLLSRVQIQDPDTDNKANISFSNLQSSTGDLEAILLDIDAWSEAGCVPESEEIWTQLESLRELKNRLFAGSFTEKCLSLFK
ncbi:MAG: TIGR04255 family protein [Verrucomicrobiales bacterium]|nr:TIGR04255 family protein [Verrucomicrobiales bacterium]